MLAWNSRDVPPLMPRMDTAQSIHTEEVLCIPPELSATTFGTFLRENSPSSPSRGRVLGQNLIWGESAY